MFNLIEEKQIPLLDIKAKLFKDSKFNCQHLHFESDNDEKVFMVAFKTVPEDSTGIAHILEHTALCGSKKYPVRDPFFMMLRRSLNTFMNAFTSSDWTAYPFATQNEKDFKNLLNVYTDAAFFPNLNRLDFYQEGHRLEFDENNDLKIKGVVFNEMKGAMSSASAQLWHGMTKHLYPDTTYQYNSGGNPKDIINLTHKDLVNFHQSHYHPSNANFFTFGNIDLEEVQGFIQENVMQKFEPLEKEFTVPLATKFKSPKYRFEAYQPHDDDKENNHVVISWLLGKSFDSYNLLEKYLLSSVLIDNSSSPLRKALETTSLGKTTSPIMGLETSNKELLFAVGLEGVAPNKHKEIESLVIDTLNDCVEFGIDKNSIDAALHQLEISQREISGSGMPYGLQLILSAMGGCIHNEDPIALIDIDNNLKKLKTKSKESNFIKDLIKTSLLDNNHRLTFELRADPDFNKKDEIYYQNLIETKTKSLEDEDIKKLNILKKELEERQELKDDISILPEVTKEDIIKTKSFIQPDNATDNFTFYCRGTNGLIFSDMLFNFEPLTQKELNILPIYAQIITELGIGKNGYEEVQQSQSLITTGINGTVNACFDDKNDMFSLDLLMSAKGLNSNQSAIEGMMLDIAENVRWDEIERIKELIQVIIARSEGSIASNGHVLAMQSASANVNKKAAFLAQLSGLNKLKFLKDTISINGLDGATEIFVDGMRSIHNKMVFRPRKLLRISSDAVRENVKDQIRFSSEVSFQSNIECDPVQKAWIIPAQVCYCSEAFSAVNFHHPDAPKLSLLSAALRNGYLHSAIREKGGAYGSGASNEPSTGVFRFFSYRDPNCKDTFDHFKKSIEWLDTNLSQQNLDEAVLNVISSIDKPLSPSGEAKVDFYGTLNGKSHEDLVAFRDGVLNTNISDIKRVAEKYLTQDSFKSVVAGEKFDQEISDLRLEKLNT